MAKHLKYGGIGIRMLLDLFVFAQKKKDSCDWKKIEAYLKQGGLLKFSETMHRFLQQCMEEDERALIINDDKPAVRKEADGWVVYGTPFSGKTDEQLNRKGKLQGICMLERGKTNEIRRMDPQEAVLLLMRQTLVPRRQEMAEKLLGMLDELFREVPVYQMQCTISECAAKMAYESMRGEGI